MPASPELIRHIYHVINWDFFQENWSDTSGCSIKLTKLYKLIRNVCEDYPNDSNEDKLIQELEEQTEKKLLTIIKQWITKFNKLRKKWDIKASIKTIDDKTYLSITGMTLPYGLPGEE